ncbi:unnamed protein product [Linum trigynum]|uniref:Uncharacterized protein n=1 Tax=Linum trigynum TaxID=586398 RepID=A0AAV2FI19_9ROSI
MFFKCNTGPPSVVMGDVREGRYAPQVHWDESLGQEPEYQLSVGVSLHQHHHARYVPHCRRVDNQGELKRVIRVH